MADDVICVLVYSNVATHVCATWHMHGTPVCESYVLSILFKDISLPYKTLIYFYMICLVIFAMWDYLYLLVIEVTWHTWEHSIVAEQRELILALHFHLSEGDMGSIFI